MKAIFKSYEKGVVKIIINDVEYETKLPSDCDNADQYICDFAEGKLKELADIDNIIPPTHSKDSVVAEISLEES